LCGYTPTPKDRFGRDRKDLAKVALGAEKTVAWEYSENISDVLKKLKKDGYQIIAVEQDKRSVELEKIKVKYPVAIIMGSEVEGIDEKTLELADTIAEIPMLGKKESLNVSVAFGIAGYGIIGR
jgi:tRNA G18 (ribose-2'-O)-methylase SpoU